MPNIEMHGFRTRIIMEDDDTALFEKTKHTIHEVVRELNIAGEAVITICQDTVERCDGSENPAPYLRVCGSDDVEVQNIIEALTEHKVGVDCETLILDDFYPDIEMGAPDDEDGPLEED